jgi:hypothetical protein
MARSAHALTQEERLALAMRRVSMVLKTNRVCSLRTLESKISDAGPYGMRVDPHVITKALKELYALGEVVLVRRATGNWYRLPSVRKAEYEKRLAELEPIHCCPRTPEMWA